MKRLRGRLPAMAGILERHWLAGLYVVLAVGVSVQRLVLHKENVFRIYAGAFRNVLAGADPYAAHPDQYADFFRYSPTFALAFAPFALVPEWLGLVLWNTANALALFWAVRRLLPRDQAQLVLLLVMGDLARAMQSCQTNPLVTALMIAAFLAYEGGRVGRAALAVASGVAIKLFPLGAALFGALRRDRRRALALVALATAALLLLPVLWLGPGALAHDYARWAAQERAETYKTMFSVMDLLDAWANYFGPRLPVQLAGLAVLLLPVALRPAAREDARWRLTLLASLLVFSVLFNYGAEPPSFVIATTGIAVWYAAGPRTVVPGVLVGLTLALVTASNLGFWPRSFGWMDAARLRVIPVLAAWIAMQVDLWAWRPGPAAAGVPAGEAAPRDLAVGGAD